MHDLLAIHRDFYNKKDKLSQDTYILKWCNSADPKRHRNTTQVTKSISIEYRLPTVNGENLRVCRAAFCCIIGVKKDRIQGIMKRFQMGKIPQENRGGDRVKGKNEAKKNAIANFIQSIKSVESHYCRSSVSARTYLPCDLNIKRLAKMYNNSISDVLKVKESYFRHYFNTNYNIGFGTPKSDVCSECLRVELAIKKAASVAKLLQTHFGDKWMENEKLKFYKNAVENSTQENQDPNDDSYHEESCSQLEKNDEFRV
ncbi:hypothetical protein NQ318_023351 [Aromia moschata]|uniref:Uncharacterized protein n=1 Tax=Aromia moschata TaxID=1265417 RepID=A0AAV8XLN8_9CUCU|nr:hypothetical protein NQ318_023351 [Aromia moschata]